MPNLGHTMEEGTVSEWLKAVGETVRKGEVILVVESDKASFDVESPVDGTLTAIFSQAGEVVAVGQSVGEVLELGVAAAPAPARGPRKAISPAARALAEEHGVEWMNLAGSGEDGLVTRDDVRAAIDKRPAAGQFAAPAPRPLSAMRRAIADATQRAWREIPHVPLHGHADVDALLALPAGSSGLTAAITRACALALADHGSFNGWLRDHVFTPAEHADIALAVSTPDGLVTAVVRQAESKSVDQLATEIGSMAASARAGRLDGAQMTGGSFAISTLGRWGVDHFVPIIAAPQVAILGVGAVRRAAREADSGALRFASELALTLVFDHRANDGVEAARLLEDIVAYLEQPEKLRSGLEANT